MKKITIETELDFIDEINLQRLVNFFGKIYGDVYSETPSESHTNITKQMFTYLTQTYKLSEKLKVLDVGCGQGPALELFKDYGMNAVGITLSEEDVQACIDKGFKAYKMDQSFLNFENNEFDFIWARHVLEHSIMPYYTLTEYRRILNENGLLYVEVPAPDFAFEHEKNPNHYSVLTSSMWKALFEKSGFEIIEGQNLELAHIENKELKDRYLAFFCRKKVSENKKKETKITLALSDGENFGWGVCSKYLKQELSKIQKINIWDYQKEEDNEIKKVDGKVVHALTGLEFESIARIRGDENYGYTFFENELTETSLVNSKKYDLILGGSNWCTEKMIDKGIHNVDTLVQGIDPEKFYPIGKNKNDELFVIFSGGKFEYRKGQDLVLKAIRILQQKYDNIILMNAWYNMWPHSMKLMAQSKHIQFEIKGNSWQEFLANIYNINGLNSEKILTHDIIHNDKLRELYGVTDIALFPNRCEGGTNLVMMEYMACGKPVIASYNSGHKDVLTSENALLLEKMNDSRLYDNNGNLWADWTEPSIDEIIDKVEYAYNNRSEVEKLGKAAGEFMKNFTWKASAKKLNEIITK